MLLFNAAEDSAAQKDSQKALQLACRLRSWLFRYATFRRGSGSRYAISTCSEQYE